MYDELRNGRNLKSQTSVSHLHLKCANEIIAGVVYCSVY